MTVEFTQDPSEQTPGTQTFFASNTSQLAKVRKHIWIGAIIWLIVSAFIARSVMGMLFSVGIILMIMLPYDLFMRRRLNSRKSLITLTSDAIESTGFVDKKIMRIFWHDVDGASVVSAQGTPYMRFKLKASAGFPDKKNFMTGMNPSQPMLLLSPLATEVQEQFIDAVRQRLQDAHEGDPSKQPVVVDEAREEQEFLEGLRSLAPHTWMTFGLIVLNVLVWLGTLMLGGSILTSPADKLLLWGGNAASEVQRGEWWRMLSATFLHSGLMHVSMNMLGLYTAGVLVERIYGHRLFLLIYFGSGLLGSALSLHYSAQQAVSVGASGAVFGVTGALLVAFAQHRDKLPKSFSKQQISGLGMFVLYALLQGFSKQGIDNAAHIGGLIGGCLAAYILPERFDMEHFRRTYVSRALIAFLATAAATVGIAATAPKAAIDQAGVFASEELVKRGLSGFDTVFKQLQQEQADIKSGKLTELEVDERSRTVYAPQFRAVAEDLSKVIFRPGDPRDAFVKDARRIAELMAEASAMESVMGEDNKLQPVDQVRSKEIETEVLQVSERMKVFIEKANKKH
jgi:rhomboid protease GluP